MKRTFLCCLFFFSLSVLLHASEPQKILQLKGTPYEIGFQHGTLLKDEIALNIERFIDVKVKNQEALQVIPAFLEALPLVIEHIPPRFVEEMQGVAAGSEQPYKKILLLNLFPEMFHCSGITVKGNATKHGSLYHVRVLDYDMGKHIQNTAVLMIVEPENGIPFANVTYAGFIGSVTGMNSQKIALGEIGGKIYGPWNGMPMAFLLREILESASSLDDVKTILETTQRSCDYYYIFSDGKAEDSFAVYATAEELRYFNPGTSFTTPATAFLPAISIEQPEESILLTAVENYPELLRRLHNIYGQITVSELQQLIKRPIAREGNLHNAIFSPATLEVWISHAGPHDEPACDQPYEYFNLAEYFP